MEFFSNEAHDRDQEGIPLQPQIEMHLPDEMAVDTLISGMGAPKEMSAAERVEQVSETELQQQEQLRAQARSMTASLDESVMKNINFEWAEKVVTLPDTNPVRLDLEEIDSRTVSLNEAGAAYAVLYAEVMHAKAVEPECIGRSVNILADGTYEWTMFCCRLCMTKTAPKG